MSVKLSSCFMLIISSLVFALYMSLFMINFKITPGVYANLKLILHDYLFTTPINNIIYYANQVLLLSGPIELNPVQKKLSVIRFCHCNLNGMDFHDSFKVGLEETFIKNHNFDEAYLSETFLYLVVPITDGNIPMNGYLLLRADRPKKVNEEVFGYISNSLYH